MPLDSVSSQSTADSPHSVRLKVKDLSLTPQPSVYKHLANGSPRAAYTRGQGSPGGRGTCRIHPQPRSPIGRGTCHMHPSAHDSCSITSLEVLPVEEEHATCTRGQELSSLYAALAAAALAAGIPESTLHYSRVGLTLCYRPI